MTQDFFFLFFLEQFGAIVFVYSHMLRFYPSYFHSTNINSNPAKTNNNVISLWTLFIPWRNSMHLQTTLGRQLLHRVSFERGHKPLPLNGLVSKVSPEFHSRTLNLKRIQMPYLQIVFTSGVVEYHRSQERKSNGSLVYFMSVWNCISNIKHLLWMNP